MEEDFADLSTSLHIYLPDGSIRLIQYELLTQLESFANRNLTETSNFCDNVRDQILNYDDENHLTKTQNNCRRIFIASELLLGICSVYGHFVDVEYAGIIDRLFQQEKFNNISRRITHKMQLELKREKYFAKEAQTKLQKDIQGTEGTTALEGTQVTQEQFETDKPQENISSPKEAVSLELAEKEASEIHNIMAMLAGHDNTSNIIEEMTAIRAEPDTSGHLLPLPQTLRESGSVATNLTEISVGEPQQPQNIEDDISQILQILENDYNEIQQPGISVEKSPTEKKPSTPQDSIDWNLSIIEPIKKPKKRHPKLIIDKITTIHNYSERALILNSNITVERVQVYEGPPNFLQAMSTNHLMKTPGFKNHLSSNVRSSKLDSLFKRHLEVEKKPFEPIIFPQTRVTQDQKETDVSKIRTNIEITEDIGARVGMHTLPGKGDSLAEITRKGRLEDLEISPTELHRKDLTGLPMSRIINSTIEPPDVERLNVTSLAPSARVVHSNGKTPDRRTSPTWFYSAEIKPPSAKYREFNYILNKLYTYWSEIAVEGLEKSITLKEFFYFEEDNSITNYLTVLRVMDKLSMQRKLFLEFKNGDVLIQPFEQPFVSEKQILCARKPPAN